MKMISVFFTLVMAMSAASGQVEPKRIALADGDRAAVTGTLSNGREAQYVFRAEKGRRVTIRNSRTSQFDFRVYNEEFDLETEFESSPVLSFDIPETGEYLFFVRKKMTAPRSAKYSLTITIKQ